MNEVNDRPWQSLSNPAKCVLRRRPQAPAHTQSLAIALKSLFLNPAKCHSLNVSDLQIETPKSKPLQRSHLHMESRAIINIVYRHRVTTEARQSAGKGAHKPRN